MRWSVIPNCIKLDVRACVGHGIFTYHPTGDFDGILSVYGEVHSAARALPIQEHPFLSLA